MRKVCDALSLHCRARLRIMITVAETIAQSLYNAGVRIVFGMPGGEVVAVLEAVRRLGIRFELMHHEESAVFAADAYARATGAPGCALTTLGPGALNAVAGIGHAWLDRAPVVLITAQKPDVLLPDYTHQVVDLQAIFSPITKRTLKATAQNAATEVPDTIALTRQGRPGPVHLQVSNEESGMPTVGASGAQAPQPPIREEALPSDASTLRPELVARARSLIAAAKRPVILAGLGLEPEAPYNALQTLAEAANAPVIVSPKGKGALRDDHPLSAGAIGLTRTDPVYEILDEADCIIAVGFDVVELVKPWAMLNRAPLLGATPPQPTGDATDRPTDFMRRQTTPKAEERTEHVPLIWIANWPNEDPTLPAAVEMVGSMRAALLQLADSEFSTAAEWGSARVRQFRQKRAAHPVPAPRRGHLLPQQMLDSMRRHLPVDSLLAVDVGSHKIFSGLEWPALHPNRFALSNGLSCMGFSLPAAIGTALARPHEPVICLIGDGGLLMCLGELNVLARLNLPVTVVVPVDNAIDLIRSHQLRQGKQPHGTEFPAPDFCAIAAGHGIPAARVTTPDACDEALTRAIAARGPFLIEAHIDPIGYPTTPR